MPEIKRCPAIDVTDFFNTDLASIWFKLNQILNNQQMATSEILAGAGVDQAGATQSFKSEVLINAGAANSGVRAIQFTNICDIPSQQLFKNRSGVDINIYPIPGDDLGNGVNIPFLLADGNDLSLICFVTGVATI